MDSGIALTLIIMGVIIILSALIFWKRELFDTSGKRGWKTSAHILSRFGFMRGCKVLSNVRRKTPDGEIVIENMLIGYFGILLVRTLGAKGEYYGTLTDEKWSIVANGKKIAFDNPVKLLERDEAVLRALLSSKKIYKVPIDRVVYLSNRSSKTAILINHGGAILSAGKLSSYLSKTKFEKDNGIDVKQIVDTVLAD